MSDAPTPELASDVPPESFVHYNAAWNERDPGSIRPHLERSVTDAVLFVDPANHVEGIDALEALIREARVNFPDAVYELTSGIDGHHGRFRYRWDARLDDSMTVPGMDVTTVDEEGRIERIDGFFGDFPAQ